MNIGWVTIEFFPGWKKIKQRRISFVLGYLTRVSIGDEYDRWTELIIHSSYHTLLCKLRNCSRLIINRALMAIPPTDDAKHSNSTIYSSANNFAYAQTLSRMSSLSGRMNIGWVTIEFFPGWKKIKQRRISFVLGYLRFFKSKFRSFVMKNRKSLI
jgi:hypothetical protein